MVNGAKVYIIDRRGDALQTVVDLYNSGPGQIIPQVIMLHSSSTYYPHPLINDVLAESQAISVKRMMSSVSPTR